MILPLVLLTNLAVTCAPQVAPATLAAVARTESDFQTLAIGDNTARRSYSPHDKSEAVALARQLMTEGHDLDLGLMQINQRNFGWLGLTVEDAFDPCRSIAAGAVVLTSLSRYNTGNPWAGISNGYVARILSAEKGGKQQPNLMYSPTVAAATEDKQAAAHQWNAFPDPAEDNWK